MEFMTKCPVTIVFRVMVFSSLWMSVSGQTYANVKAVMDDKLSSSVYDVDVRPMNDQSGPLIVRISFEILSIVEVDDVGQKFLCNGFLSATWTDERVQWAPASYGNLAVIHPSVKRIWKPRMVLMNTLAKRDIFEDDNAPMTVSSTGGVSWGPGSLFPTSCQLDMIDFPFDKQVCTIILGAMDGSTDEIGFSEDSTTVGTTFYVANGEWELLETSITATSSSFDATNYFAVTQIRFKLKRRSTSAMMNLVLPTVILSFLNIFVFAIPVDSGERIGYAITVLLSLTVYLSALSSVLPSSTITIPKVSIYLFCLLGLSALSVVVAVIIGYLHNLEVKDEKAKKAAQNFKTAFKKVKLLNNAVNPLDKWRSRVEKEATADPHLSASIMKDPLPESQDPTKDSSDSTVDVKEEKDDHNHKINKYKAIGKHIDRISFFLFLLVWSGLTLGFFISMSA